MAKSKQPQRTQQAERTRRTAAALAHATAGRARVLGPNARAYDRRAGKDVTDGA